jgi:D-proline dehydrogenase
MRGEARAPPMRVAVVGAGIAGLFAAYYLEREGVDVTLFDEQEPGARSVHAAGIIEPMTAYRTNTFAFLRRVWKYWRTGTCTFRGADPGWLIESLRQLERAPMAGMEEGLRRMGEMSFAAYGALAGARDDFGYVRQGLLERYDDPARFAEETATALAQRAYSPVEVREAAGGAGDLFFPDVGWLHTERCVARLRRELERCRFVPERVRSVTLEGTLATASGSATFDAIAVTTGVTSRKLGIPLTGVRGYGWHVRPVRNVDVATIHADRGIALVPFGDELKATGGWDFDLSTGTGHSKSVLDAIRKVIEIDRVLDFRDGSRPCTPDGLPVVGRKARLVVANGGFRLGWSFAPALGRLAAQLSLGQVDNDPFLSRFCGSLHSGAFA